MPGLLIHRFWVIKGRPTEGVKIPRTQIRVHSIKKQAYDLQAFFSNEKCKLHDTVHYCKILVVSLQM